MAIKLARAFRVDNRWNMNKHIKNRMKTRKLRFVHNMTRQHINKTHYRLTRSTVVFHESEAQAIVNTVCPRLPK